MLKIGHRGAAGLAPENTEAAFMEAINLGLDMVELDIQLTKDDHLIVFHDNNLNRIVGIEAEIKDLTLQQLKELDIGTWFAKDFVTEKILTLEEVIKLVKGEIKLNIEIKPVIRKQQLVINKLARLLKREAMINQVIISSFNHQLLKRLKKIEPRLQTAILIGSLPIKPVEMIKWADADGIHPNWKLLTKELIVQVKRAGYFINTWTVNNKQAIRRFKKLEIDGIITDYPNLLL